MIKGKYVCSTLPEGLLTGCLGFCYGGAGSGKYFCIRKMLVATLLNVSRVKVFMIVIKSSWADPSGLPGPGPDC